MAKHKDYRISYSNEYCPRCHKAVQVRERIRVGEKQLRAPFYYMKWYRCFNEKCKTTIYMKDEDKVINKNQRASYREEVDRQQSFLRSL